MGWRKRKGNKNNSRAAFELVQASGACYLHPQPLSFPLVDRALFVALYNHYNKRRTPKQHRKFSVPVTIPGALEVFQHAGEVADPAEVVDYSQSSTDNVIV